MDPVTSFFGEDDGTLGGGDTGLIACGLGKLWEWGSVATGVEGVAGEENVLVDVIPGERTTRG